jgi:hypothetical protein
MSWRAEQLEGVLEVGFFYVKLSVPPALEMIRPLDTRSRKLKNVTDVSARKDLTATHSIITLQLNCQLAFSPDSKLIYKFFKAFLCFFLTIYSYNCSLFQRLSTSLPLLQLLSTLK